MWNLFCSIIIYDSVKKEQPVNILQLLSAVHLRTQDLSLTNTVRSDWKYIGGNIIFKIFFYLWKKKRKSMWVFFHPPIQDYLYNEAEKYHSGKSHHYSQDGSDTFPEYCRKGRLSSAACYLFLQSTQETAVIKLCEECLSIVYQTH